MFHWRYFSVCRLKYLSSFAMEKMTSYTFCQPVAIVKSGQAEIIVKHSIFSMKLNFRLLSKL